MLTIAYYFLQVVLCSGMLMGYYWLVLRNKRFHQYNRFYLLAAALLSWIVPLIKITWSQPVIASEQPQVMQFLSVVADNNSQIEQTIQTQPVSEWSRGLLVTGIYFGVAAILFFGMVRAFTKLYRLLRDHSCKNVGDVYLVLTQAKGTPFSFFRYIFWNEEIDIRSEAGKQILQHELTHVHQKHSFDKLFIQVILIGGWFNPFFWLLRKEMDMIHEFIADKKAVNNGDTAALAQMLLTAAYPQQQFALTHPFFFSPIKRRLQMLTNNKNPRYSYIRRLVVLPLLAIVVVLFAFRSKERRESIEISVATVMENVATDQKQFFNPLLQEIGNFFDNKNKEQNKGFRSVFYNGRPLTVPTSFRLKDLGNMAATHLDKYPLNLTPALDTVNAPGPLYVIDGVKQPGKTALALLSPGDIQMINIWKGPDAFAKYGEAGKDGVIEISTKSFDANKKSTDGFSGLVYEGTAKNLQPYADTTNWNKNKWGNLPGLQPLIIVDGVIYKGDLNMINQDNISSVTVLKDARANEKYGDAAKNGVVEITMKPYNTPSITDSLGNRNWRTLPGKIVQGKQLPDTSTWIKGHQLPTKDHVLSDGILKAENVPITVTGKRMLERPPVFEGFKIDNSPATIELKKRNPEVKLVVWKAKTHILIQLKDGTQETYDLANPESKKRAETKYGKLPEATPIVENVHGTVSDEVTVVGYGTRNSGRAPSAGTIRGGTFSGTLSPNTSSTNFIPAEFPGGLSEWAKFLERNLDKDVPRKKGAPPGRYTVVILFDISEDGTISNVQAQNDPGYGTVEEALKFILKNPKWTPALKEGKRVGYTHKQSISFFVKDLGASLKPGNNFSLGLASVAGGDIAIAAQSTAIATVNIPGVQKGDPIMVTPKEDYTDWSVSSAWVPEENKVNVRFANNTTKEIKILGTQYKIVVVKN